MFTGGRIRCTATGKANFFLPFIGFNYFIFEERNRHVGNFLQRIDLFYVNWKVSNVLTIYRVMSCLVSEQRNSKVLKRLIFNRI